MNQSKNNWQAPGGNGRAEPRVHRASPFRLNDGTMLTACSARIGGRWAPTDAPVTCRVCLGTTVRPDADPTVG